MGVVVQEVGRTQSRLSWQTDMPINPASVTKLLTTAAALDLLGPAWTWMTPIWLDGRLSADGVLDGNLVIKGSGDPKLTVERTWLMLRRARQLGLREIRGDIVLDRSNFNEPARDPAEFDGEPLRPYNVAADALLLAQKSVLLTFTPDPARGVAIIAMEPPLQGVAVDATVPLAKIPCNDWRTGLGADVSDPARLRFTGRFSQACAERVWPMAWPDARGFDERMLRALWSELGGRISGSVREGSAPSTTSSYEWPSPPLADVVRDINKYSNNTMAQQLFLTLGLRFGGTGTPDAARQVILRWLQDRLGPDIIAGLVLDNGSGLSRQTRLSAALIARVLQWAWASPIMPELLSSLPVAGVDGTARKSRAASGLAHLKTGSLRDVAAIAGVVLAESGKRYVVVATVAHRNASQATPALDALVQWTAHDRP